MTGPGYDPQSAEFGKINWSQRKGPGFGEGSLGFIPVLGRLEVWG